MEDIRKLLLIREIIDAYKNRDKSLEIIDELHTKSINNLLIKLKEFGFNSISEFSVWNNKMNLEAFKEGFPIKGECDFCAGLDEKNINCIMEFSADACFYKKLIGVPDSIYIWSMKQFIKGNYHILENGIIKTNNGCPQDHGFYTVQSEVKNFSFNIDWKV